MTPTKNVQYQITIENSYSNGMSARTNRSIATSQNKQFISIAI